MKKILLKGLSVFLLVVLVASGNGMTVLAQGLADEVQGNAETESEETNDEDSESEEIIGEDEDSESEENVSEAEISQEPSSEEESDTEETSSDDMVAEEESLAVELQGATVVKNGTWGESVTWQLDSDGVLTVTQDEDVAEEFIITPMPWIEYAQEVTKMVWGANCLKYNANLSTNNLLGSSIGFFGRDDAGNQYSFPNLKEIIFTEHVSMEKIEDMSMMFHGCTGLTTIDLSGVKASNVKDMSMMFQGCKSLENVNLSGISTGNVTDMSYMFAGCYSLTSLDISGFDVTNVTNMKSMFDGCSVLKELKLGEFNSGNVTDMSNMFENCSSLTSLDVSGFDTSNVTTMTRMFFACSSLASLDVSGFNTGNVTDMSNMFNGCISLLHLDVSGFDTSKVTNMRSMFAECKNVDSLDVSEFKTGKVTDMSYMFFSCEQLKTLEVAGFETGNVENMACMFGSCIFLSEIDVSKFDTTNVKYMDSMFSFCASLEQLNLSNFDTQSVTDMNAMFFADVNLKSVTFGDIETGNVTDMKNMFYDCRSLANLDVSGFDTAKVTLMDNMFSGCFALKELDLSGFNTESITSMTNFLKDCNNLRKIHAIPNLLIEEVELPSSEQFSDWHVLDDEEPVKYLPTELQGSVILVRDYINSENEVIEITSLAFSKEEYTLFSNGAMQLTPIIEPENATDRRLYWTCVGNSMLNSVDQSGKVFGLEPGEVIVTVYAVSNPNVSASCKVIIKEQENELKVTFDCIMDGEEYIIYKGNSVTPKLQWIGKNDWEEVTYEVSNNTAEFVNGKLVAKETGRGTLTVRARSGSQIGPEAVVKYRVCEKASAISLSAKELLFDVRDFTEREAILEAEVANKDAALNKVKFTISGSSNIKLTDNGDNTATIQYIGNQTGTATVTVTAVDGSKKSAKCTVTAGNKAKGITIESSLPWSNPVTYLLLTGKTAKMNAVFTPSNASVKAVRWESDNPGVVSVDQNGKITAHEVGSAAIYAYATDGSEVYGIRPIRVCNPIHNIELKVLDQAGLECGDNVIALYEPDENTHFYVSYLNFDKYGNSSSVNVYYDLEWKLSGSAAKNAYMKGNQIYANKPGIITITGSALDGSKKKASIKVKVEQHVYQLDAKAPKNTPEFTQGEQTYWQVAGSAQKTTLVPVMQYNDGMTAPDKKWKNYEIVLSEAAATVMQPDKKGTGIVINANATPGDYEVTFRTTDGNREVSDSVIIRISDMVYDAGIAWPSNVIPTGETQMLAEGIKLNLLASVNGMVKNPSYQYKWDMTSGDGNQGTASLSTKGVLDLKKAKAGDVYGLKLEISKNSEVLQVVERNITITKRMDKNDVKLMLAGTDTEFPAKMEPLYAADGIFISAVLPADSANLYQVSGGKKGVIRIEETASGYVFYSEGVGSAKVTVKAMDGSNFKKDFTIKIEKPANAVAQFIVPKGTITVSGNETEYIQYKLLTKNGEVPADCRVKWEISDLSKVYFDTTEGTEKSIITNQASGEISIRGSQATLNNATLTGTTLDGSRKKVTIKIKADNWYRYLIDGRIFNVYPQNNTPYIAETGEALLIHGKSMKFDIHCNYIGYSKNRLTYVLEGLKENGDVIPEEELKALGITMKNGVLKASAKSSYSGIIRVMVGYTELTDIEPSMWRYCDVQILPPVNKVEIRNESGESILKAEVSAGERLALSAKLTGKNPERDTVYQTVCWSVSDAKYASVSSDGLVTIAENAPKNKKIKVTATAQDGSKKKSVVTITVK